MKYQEHHIKNYASESRQIRSDAKATLKGMIISLKLHHTHSISEIAKMFNKSHRTISYYIEELKQSGHIPAIRINPTNQHTKNRQSFVIG
ncbi:HTH domain-containing protein [Shewanella sp. KX20019]|uniref:HTH domain-containing protein n=1 Tax=Shewanella sp. KX20019 TaxID=2803864 RepID=UPI0019285BF3|nr:HTH domain-containing protein [Shewanella sp. KX20019]QQX82204.1 HTH domain-containing protein [Shewanella sp. KX20019]